MSSRSRECAGLRFDDFSRGNVAVEVQRLPVLDAVLPPLTATAATMRQQSP